MIEISSQSKGKPGGSLRALAVGWDLPEANNIQSATFEKAPPFDNYQTLLIDPAHIGNLWRDFLRPRPDGTYATDPGRDHGLGQGLLNLMQARREETKNLLKKQRGGVLICRLRKPGPPLKILRKAEHTFVNIYSWIPELGDISLSRDLKPTGEVHGPLEIVDHSHPLSSYLSSGQNSFACQACLEADDEKQTGDQSVRILAREQNGDRIASFEISIGNGSVIMIPPPGQGSTVRPKLFDHLSDFSGLSSKPSPRWIEDYISEKGDPLQERIGKVKEEIRSLTEQINRLENELERLEGKKFLLHAPNSQMLVKASQAAFQELGLTIEKTDTQADFLVSDGDRRSLVCVGINHDAPVGLKPYHRLLQSVDQLYLTSGSEEIGGTLVYSGFAKFDPRERKAECTDQLKTACRRHGFKLLSSIDLYEISSELLNHGAPGSAESRKELQEKLLSQLSWSYGKAKP